MSGSIDALLGIGTEPEDDPQQLANALRQQRRSGNFLSRSSIAPMAERGKSMIDEAHMAAQQAGRLRADKEKAALAARQAALPKTRTLKEANQYYDPDFNTVSIAQGSDGHMVRVGGDRSNTPVSEQEWNDIQARGKAFSPTQLETYTQASLAPINTALGLYHDINRTFSKAEAQSDGGRIPLEDIDGYGSLSGSSSLIGTLARTAERIIEYHEKSIDLGTGGANYAAGGDITAGVIREMTGLSQTAGEAQRVKDMLNMGLLATPASRWEAMMNLRRKMEVDIKNAYSGSAPVVQKALRERLSQQEDRWGYMQEVMGGNAPQYKVYTGGSEEYKAAVAEYERRIAEQKAEQERAAKAAQAARDAKAQANGFDDQADAERAAEELLKQEEREQKRAAGLEKWKKMSERPRAIW